jgi:hypothetical protein
MKGISGYVFLGVRRGSWSEQDWISDCRERGSLGRLGGLLGMLASLVFMTLSSTSTGGR